MNQMAICPVTLSRHRMSAKPSLLKSPTPWMLQSLLGAMGSVGLAVIVLPLICQIVTAPVVVLRQSMSELPSL